MALNQATVKYPIPDRNTSALDSLLQRIQMKGDFPALSQTISTINRIAADSDESVHTLSSALLKDFALTNKVLRLINSATYSRFGGTISTISRAVMILGFDLVRSLAVTLTLFEHIQKNPQASQLKEDVIAAYFTGILAHRVATLCGIADSEEGFVCGVFHHLGKLLATNYFYDEALEIDKRLQQHEMEDKASRALLGISYEDLGVGVARYWHLPERIINSIHHVAAPRTQKSPNPSDRLKLVANLAASLCRIAGDSTPEHKSIELEKLHRDFAASLNLGTQQLTDVVDDSIKHFLTESGTFFAETGKSQLLGSIKQWSNSKNENCCAEGHDSVTTGADTRVEVNPLDTRCDPSPTTVATDSTFNNCGRDAALTAGIQDITNVLVGDYDLNDVLRIILETMYRGLGFSQVLLCTRDVRSDELRARFGFGTRIEDLLKCFRIPLGQARDVFQLALNKNADVFIANTHSESVVTRIPAWYRENVNAHAFLVLPIVIKGKIIGMFYAGHDRADHLVIEPHLLQMLKTLRNQAILAIRQKT